MRKLIFLPLIIIFLILIFISLQSIKFNFTHTKDLIEGFNQEFTKVKDIFPNFTIELETNIEDLNLTDLAIYELEDYEIYTDSKTTKENLAFNSVIKDELGQAADLNNILNNLDEFILFDNNFEKLYTSKHFDNYPIGPTNNPEILESQNNTTRQNIYFYPSIFGKPVTNTPGTVLLFQKPDQNINEFFYKIIEPKLDTEKIKIKSEFKIDNINLQNIINSIKKGDGSIGTFSESEDISNQVRFLMNSNAIPPKIRCAEVQVAFTVIEHKDTNYLTPSLLLHCTIETEGNLNGFTFHMNILMIDQ